MKTPLLHSYHGMDQYLSPKGCLPMKKWLHNLILLHNQCKNESEFGLKLREFEEEEMCEEIKIESNLKFWEINKVLQMF